MDDYVTDAIADWAQERPTLDTSPMALISRILRAAEIIQSRLDAVAAEHGLSHKGDMDVLAALRRVGPPYEASPSRLARAVQLTTGGMTNRLDRLEKANLIVRRRDTADRRGVIVGLTAMGKDVCDTAFAAVLSEQARLVQVLSDDQRDTASVALKGLLLSLGDRALPPAPPSI